MTGVNKNGQFFKSAKIMDFAAVAALQVVTSAFSAARLVLNLNFLGCDFARQRDKYTTWIITVLSPSCLAIVPQNVLVSQQDMMDGELLPSSHSARGKLGHKQTSHL